VSVGPRVVVLRFGSRSAPKLRPWIEHALRVSGSEPSLDSEGPDGVLTWSLVSGNNRELGRSARLFGRFDETVEDARACILQHGELVPQLLSDERSGGYGWRLIHGAAAALVSARWYSSDRDRRQALASVQAALPVAAVANGVRVAAPALMLVGGETDD
jgi:hypothetical protein